VGLEAVERLVEVAAQVDCVQALLFPLLLELNTLLLLVRVVLLVLQTVQRKELKVAMVQILFLALLPQPAVEAVELLAHRVVLLD